MRDLFTENREREFENPAQGDLAADQDLSQESDAKRIIRVVRGLVGDYDWQRLLFVTHEGVPVSKARARWSRKSGRFYTPSKTVGAELSVASRINRSLKGEPFVGSVAVVAVFFRPNFQRIDADNLMKLVMDAATKAGAWKDDCYVMAQASYVEFDPRHPRTLIAICDTKSSMDRDRRFKCRVCEKLFNRPGCAAISNPPQFCSKKCRYSVQRVLTRCARCEQSFNRNSSGQRYTTPHFPKRFPKSASRRVRVPAM